MVNGQDVLFAAQPYAGNMVAGFLKQGATSSPAHQTTNTSAAATNGTTAPPTTTTIPPNVVTNTQPEPWNPVPC